VTAACRPADHGKDAGANYNAGSVTDSEPTNSAGAATAPPTSEVCRRADECYSDLARDLCVDDECIAALAPPPGNSDQTACANAVRDAPLRATPYTRHRSDYHMPDPCRVYSAPQVR
jgi:hypothetical protein